MGLPGRDRLAAACRSCRHLWHVAGRDEASLVSVAGNSCTTENINQPLPSANADVLNGQALFLLRFGQRVQRIA